MAWKMVMAAAAAAVLTMGADPAPAPTPVPPPPPPYLGDAMPNTYKILFLRPPWLEHGPLCRGPEDVPGHAQAEGYAALGHGAER